VNPGSAPEWVRLRHLSDEITDVLGNPPPTRPSRSALPSPVQSESSPLPLDDGLGLDNGQRLSPIGPNTREDDAQGSVSVRQAGPFSIALQDTELVAKNEVLQQQRAMGLQGREERSEKDEYQRGYDMMEAP
jgi:hypothetical protein